MANPVYGRTKSGGIRRNVVKGGVGMSNTGALNLLRHTRRNAKGQFQFTPGAIPLHVEAHKWASVGVYRQRAFDSQIKSLIEDIQGWAQHVTHDCHKVLYNAMLPTFEKSQRYCPISPAGSPPYGSPGTLRNSGRLTVRHKAGTAGGPNSPAEVTITYGGNGVPFYAVFVHEIPYRHEAPTRYKFLESALKEDHADIKHRLADGMRIVASARG